MVGIAQRGAYDADRCNGNNNGIKYNHNHNNNNSVWLPSRCYNTINLFYLSVSFAA